MGDHNADSLDRLRPTYHFLPSSGWMNDPNGLIQWKGTYHLFYQHNPNGPFWGTMHWGHAVSEDLVHWKRVPIALEPEPSGPDEDGVFSGCAVDVNGVATILYTGVRGIDQLPCVATSPDDDLVKWIKYPSNPVIQHPPTHLTTTMFRDHAVWTEGEYWYQAIGSGIEGEGGVALVYRSIDFISWEYVGPLVDAEWRQTGIGQDATGWECPDFFQVGGRHVLIVSMWNHRPLVVGYYVGVYHEHKFIPEHQGIIDPGESFYAPQSFYDEAGRRIMFGWIKESRSEAAQRAAGWSGVMSLPRLLHILEDGSLGTAPAPGVTALRGAYESVDTSRLASGIPIFMSTVPGRSLELFLDLVPGVSRPISLEVLSTDDGQETTMITFNPEGKSLTLDTRKSSLSTEVDGGVYSLEYPGLSSELIQLRVFVDHSVLEIFLNDEKCITGRAYPTRHDATGIKVSWNAGSPPIRTIDAWAMNPMLLDD